MKKTIALAATCTVFASTAHADVNLRFIEGAPKDRFEITSTSDCLIGPVSISLDLTPSAGALIFDVTEQGGGVEVFQPFELVAGSDLVTNASAAKDGGKRLTLALSALPKGMPVSFTIDLDDTLSARQITVNGAEIEGAQVSVTWSGRTQSAAFKSNARATLALENCSS